MKTLLLVLIMAIGFISLAVLLFTTSTMVAIWALIVFLAAEVALLIFQRRLEHQAQLLAARSE